MSLPIRVIRLQTHLNLGAILALLIWFAAELSCSPVSP